MRKLLLTLTMCPLVLTEAFANSIVLYGTIDLGVTVNKFSGKDATVIMSSDNWYANKLGVRGEEDLGFGNSVFFNLQMGYNPATGANRHEGSAFGRESVLGMKGQWGLLGAGRMGALSSDLGSYSILGGAAYTTFFQPIGSLYGTFILPLRVNNAVVYVSPSFSGVTGHLMYSNGTSDDSEKWSQNDHYYGAGITYKNGGFKTDMIFERFDNKADSSVKPTNLFNIGAEYSFPSFTVYGAYQYAHHSQELPDFISATEVAGLRSVQKGANQNAFSLSASTELAGGTAMLQGQYAFGKVVDNNSKYSVWSIGSTYLYPVSKQTTVYFNFGYGETGKVLKHYADSDLKGWTTTMGVSHNF